MAEINFINTSLFLLLSIITSFFLNRYIYNVFSNNKILDPVTSRSSHKSVATRSGGLSVFLSICICYAIAYSTANLVVDPYAFLGVMFMAITGIADDFFNVRYREKFFLQIFAGIIILQAGYTINSFHGIFGIYEIPVGLAKTITLFVFLVIVNALNLIDGLDGLAALILIKFFLFVAGVVIISSQEMALFFPISVGAILGFMAHNFNSSKKVFLGDTGSLSLGSIVAFFTFYMLDSSNDLVIDSFISRPLFCVLVLIYPLTDTLRVILVRSFKRQSPFVADRIHLHHRLVDKGYRHWEASLVIFILSTLILISNLFAYQFIGLFFCVVLTLGLLVLYYYLIFK